MTGLAQAKPFARTRQSAQLEQNRDSVQICAAYPTIDTMSYSKPDHYLPGVSPKGCRSTKTGIRMELAAAEGQAEPRVLV
eukprot:COSAG02_NODE_794_length_17142_cov_13.622367_12_plen_80_part_00